MNSHTLATKLGLITFEWSEHGVTRLQLPGEQIPMACAKNNSVLPPWIETLILQIISYFEGGPQSAMHEAPVDLSGLSPFTSRTLRYIKQHLAIGSTMSYSELARVIGSPGAARAVGRAMATNPVPIIIPCHRIVAADGKLCGYSGGSGLITKRLLLQIEEIT